ncbi:hypothetical protein BDR04DRAFT_1100296 [Suillus decipiens]|nr:hypothetical protein BDR04DRAFT_1100296 [Suillus decipiens]
MFAFANDHTLESLGVVLACGLYWVYCEVDRPSSYDIYVETPMDDPDYVPQMESSTGTESNNSSSPVSSILSETPDVLYHVSACIESILNGRSQFSFEDVPLCKQALAQIAVRLKACHSQFLGLQGDGKCTTCAKIVCFLCPFVVYSH